MSDLEAIQSVLVRAARRQRWERAWNSMWQGLFLGGAVWLATLVIYKLAPIPSTVPNAAGIFAGLCILGGFFRGWIRQPTLRQTARSLDSRQNLQERLSTALELAPTAGPIEGWRALLVSDAARFAAKLDPRKIYPYSLPQISRWALVLLVLGAGLGFVPEYRSKTYLEKQADAQTLKEVGKRIVEITHQTLEHRPPVMETTRKAVENAEELGLKLDKGVLTRNDALKDLANVADKLKQQLQDLGKKNPTFKALEHEARDPNNASANSGANQKQMDDLQKSLGKAGENPAALDKMAEKMQALQKAAAGMPKDNSPAAEEQRAKMAKSLSDLAEQAREMGQPLPNLDDAIADLAKSQNENFQKDMDLATTDLEKTQQMAKELQKMQQQADREGKDLPEQLKFGQADLAQQTLNRMIEKVKSGKMSSEEAAKILDEVARSVSPASPYGDASKFLHEAAEQLRGGDKPSAAESLASAAKELEKVQAEMADAKALQGSLDALNKAEMCLATHTSYGQCPHCGDCSGKCAAAGHCLGLGKNKGGRGVGAWTDDDSQLYPQMSGLWDNSGINRPDRDARGLTDRGDPQLADNLTPTKLHGQITPGAPMPSITLKGVSIKGQSSVGYTEAVTAAQSDAKSALNQDQVPRAYQGAVRDYFNDIKP
jgi:polyhydroxyalkanoate synthesis regulator phasin